MCMPVHMCVAHERACMCKCVCVRTFVYVCACLCVLPHEQYVEAKLAAMSFDLVVLSNNQPGVWGCGGRDDDDIITWPGKPVGTAPSRKHSLHLSASISCRNNGAPSLVAAHLTTHPRRTSMIC